MESFDTHAMAFVRDKRLCHWLLYGMGGGVFYGMAAFSIEGNSWLQQPLEFILIQSVC